MIKVENLEKRYGKLVAVSGVSFEIKAGEIVGLLGHNGAGKTTIMKILTGYMEPTGGSARVDGIEVREDRVAVQRLIGYLPENAPLYPEMLVQEYLMMMAELRAIPVEERVERVLEAVEATGLEERLVQPIGTLSKGYRQRVGLAQAILHRPQVLILDEPTNGLDPVQILEIRALIQKLAERTTILLSTHILQEIEAVCDRVLVLIDGHLATDRKMTEMLRSNVVRLGLAGKADGVVKELSGIEGVERVEDAGSEHGIHRFRLHCKEGAQATPSVIAAATKKGWTIDEVSPERPSLETVFRNLMHDHVARVRGKEVAA